jgi:hypothetical protein
MGQFSRSGRTADLSDDEGFPFLKKFLPHPKQVISLSTAMEMTTMTMILSR